MDLSRYQLELLREDGDFSLYRAHPAKAFAPLLLLVPSPRNMGESYLRRLEHERSLADELDASWAIKPVAVARYGRRMSLVLEDPGGAPWESSRGQPIDLSRFLSIAIGLVAAIRALHARGLIHKDIRPANVFVHPGGRVLLTGFGFASRVSRERQSLAAPESLEGTLAYIAPERTGRMDRSIDARSDLYSLGITLYEMLVGGLPFTTADPAEMIHCHVARRPPLPSERLVVVAAPLEAIIIKLLAKSAEDRYQTAAGVEFDLRRCLTGLESSGLIAPFELGAADIPDQLFIPERLYSREAELGALIEAFEFVATQGRFEFLVVSGPSGIGKSALVNELRRAPQTRRGLFAEGRSDQYKHDVPYASVAEAFQGLVRQVLCQDDFQLERWRESLQHALGSSGQLLVDLIPELALIVGLQPRLSNVPPEEERSRFFPVFRRFVCVFARPEHPLVLFLDNLQWLDSASLELLERLALDREIPHLLLIGTCRADDTEALRLVQTLMSAASIAGKATREIELGPLPTADIRGLIADALRAEPEYVRPLADLVQQKTRGNCFFVRQFLTALHVERLLEFDPAEGAWRWDLEGIAAKGITDNVATLMAAKLARYGDVALECVKYLACLGTSTESDTLATVMDLTEQSLQAALHELLGDDLLHRVGSTYVFSHDRVREAAYALIPVSHRAQFHLRIARRLVAALNQKGLQDRIFSLLNHYQQGAALIDSLDEKVFLAQLNLMAGKRAKAATAYESALKYFTDGLSLLAEESSWRQQYELRFELELYEADCRFIGGDFNFALERLEKLFARATREADLTLVVGRQVLLYTSIGKIEQALRLAIDCLARAGPVLPLHPTDTEVECEYEELLRVLGGRSIDSLIDLPPMTDPSVLGVMELLAVLCGPAGVAHMNLLNLVQLRMARLSIEYGNTDESTHGYAGLSRALGWTFGTIEAGHSFGRLALRLVDERGYNRLAERVYANVAGCMGPYSTSLRASHDLAVRAAEVVRERGGLSFVGYSWSLVVSFLFDSGAPLAEVQERGEAACHFLLEQKYFGALKMVTIPVLLVRALRGLTTEAGSFSDSETDEVEFERSLSSEAHRHSVPRYWARRLQLKFYAGDLQACLEAIAAAKQSIVSAPVYELTCEVWFFSALTHAATLTGRQRDAWGCHFEEILQNHRKLSSWAARHPTNFADRACLVAAEIARLEGRIAEAGRLYEEAIRLSGEHGFVQNAGIANELAAQFYAPQGLQAIADAYLRNARACYLRWGADGKVRQLDQRYPHLTESASGLITKAEVTSRVQHLDVAAVIEMHHAVSGELVLDRLIERLMITVVEHAGAVRGLVLLAQERELRIAAEAVTGHNSVIVHLRHQPAALGELPQSVLNYVVRTQEYVILGDATAAAVHSSDEYVLRIRPRSILCLPLVKQTRLVGVLYLENTLSPNVFTADRLAVLQLLASQAAISIENAVLFRDIQKAQEQARIAEEELRRTFDMIPTLAWRALPDGSVDFVNQQWLAYSGFTSEDVRAGRWVEVFHPDDKEKVWATWLQCLASGNAAEVEARMLRFDGEFRSFLVRAMPMRDDQGRIVMWHGTNTDIEGIKRAEQAQEALARASRLTAMGELTVSIAHEMSQPLMAIESNATACLQWLAQEQFNLSQARMAADRIVGDVHRARDVIASIRGLARKAAPEMVLLDLNSVIVEVLELARSEIDRHGISLATHLACNPAPVLGVRVQLQQVVLNLVMNGIEAIAAASGSVRQMLIRSADDDDRQVTVSVADTGVGIVQSDREKIFDAFFTTKPEGLGMGLSICRSIVEALGGRLWVAPNSERGSVFSFCLPLLTKQRGETVESVGTHNTATFTQ